MRVIPCRIAITAVSMSIGLESSQQNVVRQQLPAPCLASQRRVNNVINNVITSVYNLIILHQKLPQIW